jgi:hypothetical protein
MDRVSGYQISDLHQASVSAFGVGLVGIGAWAPLPWRLVHTYVRCPH